MPWQGCRLFECLYQWHSSLMTHSKPTVSRYTHHFTTTYGDNCTKYFRSLIFIYSLCVYINMYSIYSLQYIHYIPLYTFTTQRRRCAFTLCFRIRLGVSGLHPYLCLNPVYFFFYFLTTIHVSSAVHAWRKPNTQGQSAINAGCILDGLNNLKVR